MTRLTIALFTLSAIGILATVNATSRTDAAIAHADETIGRACIYLIPDAPPWCERVPGVTENNGRVAFYAPKP